MSTFNVSQIFGFLGNTSEFCNTTTITCAELTSPCKSPKGLNFASLWNISLNYAGICGVDGAWLFDDGTGPDLASPAMTNLACESIVRSEWTKFPEADIWSRLTTWKFPLIQLIASSPRPPLDTLTEFFAFFHLTSDPIGSLQDALWKVDCCQRRAAEWRELLNERPDFAAEDKVKLARALALITESYAELGQGLGTDAETALRSALSAVVLRDDVATSFREECYTTAGALAADRATTVVPVLVAEVLFISVFVIDVIRLTSVSLGQPSSALNIEVHSIGFSALFFWLISTVMVTATIGASQTAEAIPRILRRFQRDLNRIELARDLLDVELGKDLPDTSSIKSKDRRLHGGVYTWQPLQPFQLGRYELVKATCKKDQVLMPKYSRFREARSRLLRFWPFIYIALPWLVFIFAIGTGMLISGYVPPKGWTDRSMGEMVFAMIWIGSYIVSCVFAFIARTNYGWLAFYLCFIKDMLVTFGVCGWILTTQVGYYNRCEAYTRWGAAGLVLPEQPSTYATLQGGLTWGGSFTWILGLGIFLQAFFFPGILLLRYWNAKEVFLLKDSKYKSGSVQESARSGPTDTSGLLETSQLVDRSGPGSNDTSTTTGVQPIELPELTFSRTGTASFLV